MLMIMGGFEVSMRSRMLPEVIRVWIVYHVLESKVISYF